MKYLKFWISISIFLLSALFLHAQEKKDSLWNEWKNADQMDSLRILALNKFIWDGLLYSDGDSAKVLATELLEFSKSRGSLSGEAMSYNTFGAVAYLTDDYDTALDYWERKLKIDQEVDHKVNIAGSLGNIGLAYKSKGDVVTALEYFDESYKIKIAENDLRGQANSTTNIGNIYLDKGSYLKALNYHKESLRLEEELDNKRGIAGSLINLANIYLKLNEDSLALINYDKAVELCDSIGEARFMSNALQSMGSIMRDMKEYGLSLKYYEKGLELRQALGSKRLIANSYHDLGTVYEDMGSLDKAYDYFEKAMTIRKDRGYKSNLAFSLMKLGDIESKNLNYGSAISYCQEAYEIGKDLLSSRINKDACNCLYKVYKASGNGERALYYHELKLAFEDSLQIDETKEQLQRIEFEKLMVADSLQREEEKLRIEMEHQKEITRKENFRNYSIAGGVFFLFLALGFYSRMNYIKRSKSIIEEEKNRSENLLLNILPYEIAQELKENGEALARDFENVSIMFTDFKSFTQTSSNLSAGELVKEINYCFKGFDEIIEKYGIEKIKTIGDAYMAAGGLPVPGENSTKNTVLAALEMQEFIRNRKIQNDKDGKVSFEMRVGVHTGPVVAGIVGVKKFQYDVWGDTVNTASRMESHGEVGKVNLSRHTFELLKDDPDFTFEKREKIEVKGKGELDMYFVEFR